MTADLDTLARGAAADLRAATAAVVAGGERPPSTRGRVAALLAVVALVAVALAVVLVDRGGDADVIVRDRDELPRLVLGAPPEGLEPVYAGTIESLPASELAGVHLAVYGGDGGELGIVVVRDADTADSLVDVAGGEPVEVRGRSGAFRDQEPIPGHVRRSLAFSPGDGVAVTLLADRLDDGELLRVAEGLTVGDGGGAEPSYLPDGYERRGAATDLAVLGAFPVPLFGRGYVAGWGDGESRALVVATMAGDESTIAVLRYLLGPGTEPVGIRGHDGWRSADGLRLVWQEAPGVVVVVGTYPPVDAETVAAAADRVEPADDATWEALEAAAEAFDEEGGDAGVGTDVAGGPSISVTVGANGELCLEATSEGSASFSCQPGTTEPQLHVDEATGTPVVYGTAPAGVVTVEVRAAGAAFATEAGGEGRPFVLTLDGVSLPVEVVYLDGAGAEVRRTTLG